MDFARKSTARGRSANVRTVVFDEVLRKYMFVWSPVLKTDFNPFDYGRRRVCTSRRLRVELTVVFSLQNIRFLFFYYYYM